VEQPPATEGRVAVLVDCDNTTPEILEYALRAVAQFGRLVIRRGYGNHHTLANKWQEALVRLAFTPCLQFQYAPGKNTSDLALALDAMEALFDARADTFCLVTSDSDFAYLCRKLRERGATVGIVGEAKTPDALRNASDHFFEWLPADATDEPAANGKAKSTDAAKKRTPKKRPKTVISAVALLGNETPDGWVGLGAIGQYLKRTDPSFSSKSFGYAALSDMIRAYPELALKQEGGSGLWVTLKSRDERVGQGSGDSTEVR